jgi:putative SbcD/Mre11-related phosphoesterase
MSVLLDGPDGWLLMPEGAAFHPLKRTAVISDVHLGYEWARGRSGDCLPAHSLDETCAKLEGMLARAPVARLIVAGDLVEARRPCSQTARDVTQLNSWLSARGVALVALAGNHDPPCNPPLPDSLQIDGWTICHGHQPLDAPQTISGHHHPMLRARGVKVPCFLVGASTIILPAFSANAAGVSLAALPYLRGRERLRCVASAGGTLLDFGPVARLLPALQVASICARA